MGCVVSKEVVIFPKVKEVVENPTIVDKYERAQYQYSIVMRYLRNKIAGWKITDFLRGIETTNLAIYAITEFTDLICEDMQNEPNSECVKYICDKNADKYGNGYGKYAVVNIDRLIADYKQKKIDKVLICSIFHVNEIFEELINRGIALEDLISVTNAIFSYSCK